ncbi:MAG: deoxyribose-phosphate aldolase [Anaerolineales bacterium]|nr:deoxyribose-phosphate aldolase [Anaerolineales bacterium]
MSAALSRSQLAALIDHTLLKPEATTAQIEQLCAEAVRYGFAAVCVNPAYVKLAARLLRRSSVSVCTVAGFPLGATLPEVKAYEAARALELGAREIDMVINIGALRSGDEATVARDIRTVAKAVRAGGGLLKVILETALLTDDQKRAACRIAKKCGADFVKTSTGFAGGGATVADVALMRETVGPKMGVKAAGGIRSLADAQALIAAGANRLGTSAGVAIMEAASTVAAY